MGQQRQRTQSSRGLAKDWINAHEPVVAPCALFGCEVFAAFMIRIQALLSGKALEGGSDS